MTKRDNGWLRTLIFNELGKKECEDCGSKSDLHFHHKDFNPKNNFLKNIAILCVYCHAKRHALHRIENPRFYRRQYETLTGEPLIIKRKKKEVVN